MMTRSRMIAWLTALTIIVILVGIWQAGAILVMPSQAKAVAPEDLPLQDIALVSDQQTPINGWWLQGPPDAPAVLLLHSVRTNRMEMIRRARALYKRGYSVLMIDLQAHGESPGDQITFGFLEAQGVTKANEWLKQHSPHSKLGVVGISLGGASLLMSDARNNFDAVVLEMVYPTIHQAIFDRLAIRFGDTVATVLTPVLTLQMKPRMGFSEDQLRPIDHITQISAPILIVGGAKDRHTRLAETQAMFDAAKEPKQLWILPDAHHQDFYTKAPEEYEKHVFGFLDDHLKK